MSSIRRAKAATLTAEEFESRVRDASEAPALELDDVRLTYGEVNLRANRLARHLQTLGAGPEVLVAVHLDRSFDLVVAILAVLKSGAAWLPLDPDDPPERLRFVLEDAHAPIVIGRSSTLSSLSLPAGALTCVLDDPAEEREIAAQDGTNLEVPSAPDRLAYVIYTSGSTGRPKGVLVTHGNLDRLFRATEPLFAFGPRDVWTLFHSCAFDFSVWELWGALRYGGRLVIVPRDVARSPDAFHDLLARTGVTVLNQTPSAFRQLAAYDASGPALPALRLLILGGESLAPGMLAPWFDRHGDERPRIVNMYGITETTVHVTHRTMTRSDLARPSASVIGRPIPDLQVWIVGEDGKPCPPGTVGEIRVGGPGVSRGYLRRPELTRERFIENPFASGDERGGRLYKSGDLGRLSPDGEIEYLGRSDQQMKIRGHRIEPGEVEAALREHPAIREAAVAAVVPPGPDGPGREAVLIACVVLSENAHPTGPDLRGFLRTKLPESMIPASFAVFDSLPLTSNGKLDRATLTAAAENGVRVLPEGSSAAAENPLHAALARIWMQALGIASVGSSDDFFALGGDSLRAARVMARVRDDFEVEVPLRAIFECRTIEHLAATVEAARAAGKVAPPRPRIRPVSRGL